MIDFNQQLIFLLITFINQRKCLNSEIKVCPHKLL